MRIDFFRPFVGKREKNPEKLERKKSAREGEVNRGSVRVSVCVCVHHRVCACVRVCPCSRESVCVCACGMVCRKKSPQVKRVCQGRAMFKPKN